MYKSVIEQGPKYVNDMFIVNSIEGSFRLLNHILQLESTVLKVFVIKLVFFEIF